MNIKNLLKIKKQVQETDEILGDSNQASIAMANNYINAVNSHIESYKKAINELPHKINKIPDNVLQDTIEYLVRNNINTGNYHLNYILNLPTLIIHNEYNKYIQRTDKYINESNIFNIDFHSNNKHISDGTNFTFSVSFNNDIDNIELFERNSSNNLFNIHLPLLSEKCTKTITYNSYYPETIDSIKHIDSVLTDCKMWRYTLVKSSDNEKIYNLIDEKELYNIVDALEHRLKDFGYHVHDTYIKYNINEKEELTDDLYIQYPFEIRVSNPVY